MERLQSTTKSSARSAKSKSPSVQREYTAVIELVREAQKQAGRADNFLWQIGDALIDACGKPGPVGFNDQSGIKMSECAKELKDEGLDKGFDQEYSLAYLKKLRKTSADFPEEKRLSSVSWAAHSLAGDRATLDAMLEKAKSANKRLTTTFVKDFKRKQDEKAQKENKNDPDSAYRNCVDKAKKAQEGAKDLVDLATNAETLITPHLPKLTERKKLITAIRSARDEATNVAKAWDKFLQTVSAAGAA